MRVSPPYLLCLLVVFTVLSAAQCKLLMTSQRNPYKARGLSGFTRTETSICCRMVGARALAFDFGWNENRYNWRLVTYVLTDLQDTQSLESALKVEGIS
ncbi:unnamed protein product [Bemisia tabaci]|uniref:Uncharacterized protein n=1 Tax=Bemisia tabaci TaxID=7038 RepID=A0A9P0ABZ4_BEMTA|nr:unnamed protein product [Bemisia tabaci]